MIPMQEVMLQKTYGLYMQHNIKGAIFHAIDPIDPLTSAS